jgi:arylformamidase
MTPDFFKKHPCFSEAACHWMVDHGVKLVAIDVPSVDDATVGAVLGEVQPCHYILMEGGVIIIENITNLREIAKPEVELIALPLPLKGLEACPIRMVAIEEG